MPDVDWPVGPATPSGGTIAPGATAYVNDIVVMRAAPTRDAPVVIELDRGTSVEVIGAAEEGDGYLWWPVREPVTRSLGYVRAEFLSPTAS